MDALAAQAREDSLRKERDLLVLRVWELENTLWRRVWRWLLRR
jgi:hypothetical protein